MCAELLRLLVSLVLAAAMVFGFTRLIDVELDQAHALLYAPWCWVSMPCWELCATPGA